jgi:hypothetical protein
VLTCPDRRVQPLAWAQWALGGVSTESGHDVDHVVVIRSGWLGPLSGSVGDVTELTEAGHDMDHDMAPYPRPAAFDDELIKASFDGTGSRDHAARAVYDSAM